MSAITQQHILNFYCYHKRIFYMIKNIILVITMSLLIIGCSTSPTVDKYGQNATEMAMLYVKSYVNNDFKSALLLEDQQSVHSSAETLRVLLRQDIEDANDTVTKALFKTTPSVQALDQVSDLDLMGRYATIFLHSKKNIFHPKYVVAIDESDSNFAKIGIDIDYAASETTAHITQAYALLWFKLSHNIWGIQNVEGQLTPRVIYKRVNKELRHHYKKRYTEVSYALIRHKLIPQIEQKMPQATHKKDAMYQKMKKMIDNDPKFNEFSEEQKEKMIQDLLHKMYK